MQIRRVGPSEVPSVYALLAANGWAHRLGDLAQFTQLVAVSQRAEVAILDGQVVGFLRGITDGQSNGYLSMVVVAPAFRGQGVGRALVEHAMHSTPEVTWVLRAGRSGASEFFAKLGFSQSTIAMERPRTPSAHPSPQHPGP